VSISKDDTDNAKYSKKPSEMFIVFLLWLLSLTSLNVPHICHHLFSIHQLILNEKHQYSIQVMRTQESTDVTNLPDVQL